MATGKKPSAVNVLQTRGKRVIAEATVPRQVIKVGARAPLDQVLAARQTSNLGNRLSGAISNSSHAVNVITVVFVATGQDVANGSEASASSNDARITADGDYYSVTLPSLIVATYGGTGLATQRECLEMMGCYWTGKVRRLAEIIAATVLCGEISLGTAIVADEWVSSHDQYGRNR